MEERNINESLSCASCLNKIGDDDYVSALGQDWHKDCFRCSVCDELLSSWYFEKAGLLFCQNDYWARYGESCQQCAQVITGPVMAAGEHRFHPECFACVACCSHIEDGQPYALLERSNLYCGGCYSTLDRKSAHAIRALEVPKTALRADRTNGLTFTQVDSSCGLLTLHIGDRILEINGTPVRNRPIEEIEKVLARPDTVIQLTVEHNPETTNATSKRQMCTQQEEDKQRNEKTSPPERVSHGDESSKEAKHSTADTLDIPEQRLDDEEVGGKRERLFKRKGDGGGKVRVIKRRQTPSSPLLGDKERSSSMSKLLDAMCGVDGEHCEEGSGGGVLRDLSRARSFRAHPDSGQRVFRACDLLQGELLGSGFFGEVYKVTHRDTNEVMVLKQLYRVDEDAQRNFLKEVAVLRSLEHPNVLRFVGVLYKDKRLHLVTEFVGGGTLHQVIQDDLRWWERARLARDVAAGVGYLHRMNLIHRDLNSHNCLVRDDRTVVVADFGLARIVRRTASSTLDRRSGSLRRKRYTVVGNPYWMAPEMMNGDVYDEKVDVFSFGIILCEIIGRVSADPDYLPRRGDFGLNECAFIDKFCLGAEPCPEALYRLAFLACHLDPEHRPPFEVMEIWLESLAVGLRDEANFDGGAVLSDIAQYASRGGGALRRSPSKATQAGVEAPVAPPAPRVALGKCVSASHIGARMVRVAKARRSRSHHSLHHTPGYILRAHHDGIDITPVDDITEWLDPPPPLKRTSPDDNLNHIPSDHTDCTTKTRRVDHQDQGNLPSFLRNQSYEELEAHSKVDAPLPMCRHFSIPDDDCTTLEDSDSSDDDLTDSKWYKNVTKFKKLDKMEVDQPKNILANIVKKGENLLSKKSSYNVTDVNLRNPERLNERRLPEIDCRRFNIDHLTKNKLMAEGVKNIAKNVEVCKPDKTEKSVFSPTKLLSPKLKRMFKPNSAEVVKNKQDISDKEEKSRSKFFVQRPGSPSNICRSSYRVRPAEEDRKPTIHEKKLGNNVIKADLKLASLGKPMTPIFRRHIHTERPEFADGRFSYRDRSKQEPKFVDVGRNRIKAPIGIGTVDKNIKLAPILRSAQTNKALGLASLPEKNVEKRREPGISRSNYVSLANLKINSKGKDLENNVGVGPRANLNDCSPAERVI